MVCPLFPNYNDHFIRFSHLYFINILCAFYMFERVDLLCLRESIFIGSTTLNYCPTNKTPKHRFFVGHKVGGINY